MVCAMVDPMATDGYRSQLPTGSVSTRAVAILAQGNEATTEKPWPDRLWQTTQQEEEGAKAEEGIGATTGDECSW